MGLFALSLVLTHHIFTVGSQHAKLQKHELSYFFFFKSKEECTLSSISSLCRVNCLATEIKGPFVSCPTFWGALHFPSLPPVTSLLESVSDRHRGEVGTTVAAGTLSADLWPTSGLTPTANSSRPGQLG